MPKRTASAGAKDAPERLSWGVKLLAPHPSDALLEIGCGRGVAAAILSGILTTGSITGIDRSATAIDAATRLNAAAVAQGRASFLLLEFGEEELTGQVFDGVLAMNVNRFWRTDADESALWRPILGREARIVLVFEAPPGGPLDRQIEGSRRYLERSGFEGIEVRSSDSERAIAGIIGRWRGGQA